MSYAQEMSRNWRPLAATALGLAAGFTLNLYIANIFAPHLLREFGWSRSQYALTGLVMLVALPIMPVVGRMTDRFGPRRMIRVGVLLMPAIYLAYSAMSGSIVFFLALSLVHLATGAVTTSLVYSRLIAEAFDRARGIALAIAACAAPAAGAIVAPLLSRLIDAHGWRTGYVALAVGTAAIGLLALALIPADIGNAPPVSGPEQARRNKGEGARKTYREILRSPAFRWIATGMLLCNLTMMVQSSQLGLILLDRGASSSVVATMLSIYAGGIVVGRLLCGLALDRYPAHLVATLFMGLPSLGLALLAAGYTATPVLALGVAAVGLSMGAELDILAYLVMRYFRVEIYSSVYGLLQPVISLSAGIGSALLGWTLSVGSGFSPFLAIASATTFVGCFAFLALARIAPTTGSETSPQESVLAPDARPLPAS